MNLDIDRNLRTLFLGLFCIFTVFILILICTALPSPKTSVAEPEEFSAQRARTMLQEFLGDGVAHRLGSSANEAVRGRIVRTLTRLGYKPEVQTGFVCDSGYCAEVSNIIAILPGDDPNVVLLVSHYDSVAVGAGASDDGVGVATVLEVAESLKRSHRLRHSVGFLIDDGEEAGLLGAQFFISDNPVAKNVQAVVNLDARGTSGPSLMFETGTANEALVDLYAKSVKRPRTSSIYYLLYKLLPNDTDFSVFKDRGYQGFNLAFIGDPARYHTPTDDLAHVEIATLKHEGDSAISLIRALANTDLSSLRNTEAVYFDFLSWWTIHWAVLWSRVCSVVVVLLMLTMAGWCVKRRLTRARPLGLSFTSWPIILFCSALLGFSIFSVLRHAGAFPMQWIAHPLAALALSWSIGFLAVILVAAVFGPCCDFWSLWLTTWSWWSLMALVFSFVAPGVSYFFLVPSVAAALTALCRFSTYGARFVDERVVALAPIVVGAFIGFSTVWFFYDGFGQYYLAPNSILAAIILTPIAPLAAGMTNTWKWISSLAMAGLVLLLFFAVLLVSKRSQETREKVSMDYLYDFNAPRGQWLLYAESGRVPPGMQSTAKFATRASQPLPWSIREFFVADAPDLHLAPPTLTLLSSSRVPGAVSYRILVRSAREGSTLTLLFPVTSNPKSMAVRSSFGAKPSVELSPSTSEWSQFTCFTMPPEGLELAFTINSEAPVDMYLVERSFGLPPSSIRMTHMEDEFRTVFRNGDTSVVSRRLQISPTTR
jgi:hypothetical protein